MISMVYKAKSELNLIVALHFQRNYQTKKTTNQILNQNVKHFCSSTLQKREIHDSLCMLANLEKNEVRNLKITKNDRKQFVPTILNRKIDLSSRCVKISSRVARGRFSKPDDMSPIGYRRTLN